MSSNLGGDPILDWQQACDLVAYQDGRAPERLHTDVGPIYAAICRRLNKHGPLDIGDPQGRIIGRLELDAAGKLQAQRLE